MGPEQAQIIALKALGWLAGTEELCSVFLGSTGGSADDLREQASDPSFQASVLEFLTMDDAWVVAFCDAHDLAYDQPLRARYALPGAEQVNWT
ncbi:DUF3572 domain-containing protein [Cognatiyoonia sp. IB215182]|uniref:DUF3572 domain-containing protein n=1 Tax=Cognatiyoonia sp. IB215182 TaxID=3097353 RepID=UPI002A0B68FD|nr:DUF3572 domain-containing protein [Cognatiyoonia sp. IB215182]MDX8351013.1 DUF3572 domain-containing protein [Cognatiyoonia sp. IB215182]